MNTRNFRNAARRPKSTTNRCWQRLGICDDTPLSSRSQAWTEPPEYPGRRRDAFMRLLLAQCQRAGSALLFVSHDRSLQGLFDASLSWPAAGEALS